MCFVAEQEPQQQQLQSYEAPDDMRSTSGAVLTEREVIRSSCWSSIDLHSTYSFIYGCAHAPTKTVRGRGHAHICALFDVKHVKNALVSGHAYLHSPSLHGIGHPDGCKQGQNVS